VEAHQDVVRSRLAFWWACALAAPPVAAIVAAAGWTMPVGEPAHDLVAIALWSIAEEIVFRGAVQPALAKRFGAGLQRGSGSALRVTPANVATSALFAALHLWRHPAAVALAILPVSLVYGVARDASGRVWPAAALHLYFNLLLYAASWLHLGAGR
jgi:membrane protease YdiL (CAAX protease family)